MNIRRTIVAMLVGVSFLLGLGAIVAQPASAQFGTQTFRVAPFSRSIKVSLGGAGMGIRQRVYGGNEATIPVLSVQIPAHCVLQTTHFGWNASWRNDRDWSMWKTGVIMPYGKTTARMVCR